jgi:hypothetical protein
MVEENEMLMTFDYKEQSIMRLTEIIDVFLSIILSFSQKMETIGASETLILWRVRLVTRRIISGLWIFVYRFIRYTARRNLQSIITVDISL